MVEGAETLFFLGALAFGFRSSLFERFWPLAIQISVASRAHAWPQLVLPSQGSAQAPARNIVAIQVIFGLQLNAESIGFEMARYGEQGSCAEFRPCVSRYPATARRLLAQLLRCLIA